MPVVLILQLTQKRCDRCSLLCPNRVSTGDHDKIAWHVRRGSAAIAGGAYCCQYMDKQEKDQFRDELETRALKLFRFWRTIKGIICRQYYFETVKQYIRGFYSVLR